MSSARKRQQIVAWVGGNRGHVAWQIDFVSAGNVIQVRPLVAPRKQGAALGAQGGVKAASITPEVLMTVPLRVSQTAVLSYDPGGCSGPPMTATNLPLVCWAAMHHATSIR